MIHVYQPGTSDITLILLHGTGGNEHDLIPLAKALLPEAAILSLRGNINENGMLRFFKRHAPGTLDEASVVEETHNVLTFLRECEITYGIRLSHSIAVGYSNGANLLASLLFHYGEVFQGVLLHHPMMPLSSPSVVAQASKVWIGAGKNDPIVPVDQTTTLATVFASAGAKVQLDWFTQGHQLSQAELQAAKNIVQGWV